MFSVDFLINAGPLIAYIAFFLIIFAESGILIGFFLPGDSFLFTLGILASKGDLNIWLLISLGIIGAILGDSVGYMTGRRFGPALFNRPDSKFFKKENIEKAHAFYEKYGKKTIIIARFTPFVRTFAPIVAGIAKMSYPVFLIYNIIGGVLWVSSVTLLGYFLGSKVEHIDLYTIPVILAIIILSVVPSVMHVLKERKKK